MQFGSNEKLIFTIASAASFISGAALAWGMNKQQLEATRQDNNAMRLELAAMHRINTEYQSIYSDKLVNIQKSQEILQSDISEIKNTLQSIGWRGKASFVPVAYEF